MASMYSICTTAMDPWIMAIRALRNAQVNNQVEVLYSAANPHSFDHLAYSAIGSHIFVCVRTFLECQGSSQSNAIRCTSGAAIEVTQE
jgi:hypothetical protein